MPGNTTVLGPSVGNAIPLLLVAASAVTFDGPVGYSGDGIVEWTAGLCTGVSVLVTVVKDVVIAVERVAASLDVVNWTMLFVSWNGGE